MLDVIATKTEFTSPRGIRISQQSNGQVASIPVTVNSLLRRISGFGIDNDQRDGVERIPHQGRLGLNLSKDFARSITPESDTSMISGRLNLDTLGNTNDLALEILVSMLASPQSLTFATFEALETDIQVRVETVRAAQRTRMAFHTSAVNRPEQFWRYDPDAGFVLKQGKSLIDALEAATQPSSGETPYSFSCYRASEYVMLLGMARVMAKVNPALYKALESVWRVQPIASRRFHDTFVHEFGSMEHPLPSRFYIPGDRVWFRNPDPASADVSGYEGSWVIYLGSGFFSNFWNDNVPFTLESKCIEIFHWRNAVVNDVDGETQIDEARARQLAANQLLGTQQSKQILSDMMRFRDPRNVYQGGGCIDRTREYGRCILPDFCEIDLC